MNIPRNLKEYKTGLKNPNIDSMLFPNVNDMTMKGMKDPVLYYGLTNGKVTDKGIAYPGEDFKVNGQSTVEYRIKDNNMNNLPKFQSSGDAKPLSNEQKFAQNIQTEAYNFVLDYIARARKNGELNNINDFNLALNKAVKEAQSELARTKGFNNAKDYFDSYEELIDGVPNALPLRELTKAVSVDNLQKYKLGDVQPLDAESSEKANNTQSNLDVNGYLNTPTIDNLKQSPILNKVNNVLNNQQGDTNPPQPVQQSEEYVVPTPQMLADNANDNPFYVPPTLPTITPTQVPKPEIANPNAVSTDGTVNSRFNVPNVIRPSVVTTKSIPQPNITNPVAVGPNDYNLPFQQPIYGMDNPTEATFAGIPQPVSSNLNPPFLEGKGEVPFNTQPIVENTQPTQPTQPNYNYQKEFQKPMFQSDVNTGYGTGIMEDLVKDNQGNYQVVSGEQENGYFPTGGSEDGKNNPVKSLSSQEREGPKYMKKNLWFIDDVYNNIAAKRYGRRKASKYNQEKMWEQKEGYYNATAEEVEAKRKQKALAKRERWNIKKNSKQISSNQRSNDFKLGEFDLETGNKTRDLEGKGKKDLSNEYTVEVLDAKAGRRAAALEAQRRKNTTNLNRNVGKVSQARAEEYAQGAKDLEMTASDLAKSESEVVEKAKKGQRRGWNIFGFRNSKIRKSALPKRAKDKLRNGGAALPKFNTGRKQSRK